MYIATYNESEIGTVDVTKNLYIHVTFYKKSPPAPTVMNCSRRKITLQLSRLMTLHLVSRVSAIANSR